MTFHFISDLHLDRSRPALAEGFLAWLAAVPRRGDRLYILGDLFEVWLGDDDASEFNQQIIAALAACTSAGVDLRLMHGNRDFLLGADFCSATGGQLVADPAVIDCFDRPVLLMHGDSLCTRDVEYLKVRAMLRDPGFQAQFLARPLEERATFAANARLESKQHTATAAMEIMDVTPDEVVRTMGEAGVDLMIHGHTHRPRVHHLLIDDRPATRIVLGDWGRDGWALAFDAAGYHLHSFPLGDPATHATTGR